MRIDDVGACQHDLVNALPCSSELENNRPEERIFGGGVRHLIVRPSP
jgi:hypothetical protein